MPQSSGKSYCERMSLAVSFDDVVTAAARLEGRVHRTPLMSSSTLNELVGATVRAKAEHLQRTGSFKIRGALNRILQLNEADASHGVVAFSSGNHAQAVALAGRLCGVSVTIVMPSDAPAVKKAATLAYGAQIVGYNRATEDRVAIASAIATRQGSVLIPPFNDLSVIAGQGTVGLEVADEWPEVEVAVIPVGGGGLISGMAVALKALNPRIRIIGVEPEVADDARQSLAAGRIVAIAQPVTIADGVATTSVGTLTFPILQALVDEIVTVSEDEIRDAVRFIGARMKQLVEPTGALTTAALLRGRVPDVQGRQILTVFCGGNADPA
jgi:threo-3-hydroxy-L-aspartate ammonia-lyase